MAKKGKYLAVIFDYKLTHVLNGHWQKQEDVWEKLGAQPKDDYGYIQG